MPIQPADRLKYLPPYLFSELDRLKREAQARGMDIIDLGVGDPDLPTPQPIIDILHEAASDPANHRYPATTGLPILREEIAAWYAKRFNVTLDPHTEVLPLIGSKEGIAHLPLAVLNPGDVALVPEPGYPPYHSGVVLAGGVPHVMPLLEENHFLPDLTAILPETARDAKLLFLNYPNNPTAACASVDFFQQVVQFAEQHHVFVCHDAAYSEIAFNGYSPPSFLEARGAKAVGVEFHSLSKTFNMTGWRIGFAVGNAQALQLLAQVKSNIDSGVFQAIQIAGIWALKQGEAHVAYHASMIKERRDIVVGGFNAMGWRVRTPQATMFVWVPVPPGYTSGELAKKFLEDAGIMVTPGNGFGPHGEGFIRIALAVERSRLEEAMERIKHLHQTHVTQ